MISNIKFYEGSYQYKTLGGATSLFSSNLARLGSGMLTELNHQAQWRTPSKTLWAEYTISVDGEVIEQYRVTRISNTQLKMVDVLEGMEIKIPVFPNEPIFVY